MTRTKTTKQPERKWEVWPNMPHSAAVQLEGVVSFPDDESGFRLACLKSLEQTNALVHSFVKEILELRAQEYPLVDRAIRAGFIVHQLGVKRQLNRRGKNQYVVAYVDSLDKSRADIRPEVGSPYTVTRHVEFGCTCEDWKKSKRAHVAAEPAPPRVAYQPVGHAPHLEGLGVCCEHVLAVILKAKIDAFVTDETENIIERRIHPNGL